MTATASLLNSPLEYKYLLRFCNAAEIGQLRRTCHKLTQALPFEWTIKRMCISDEKSPYRTFTKHDKNFIDEDPVIYRITMKSFRTFQRKYQFLEKIVVVDLFETQLLVLEDLPGANDLSMVNARRLEELTITPGCNRWIHCMIFNSPKLRKLVLPDACRWIKTLCLSNLNLSRFEFSPSWCLLKSIVLDRIGQVAEITIPSTYTSLEFLQTTRVGLKTLTLSAVTLNPQIISVNESSSSEVTITTSTVQRAKICLCTSCEINWSLF